MPLIFRDGFGGRQVIKDTESLSWQEGLLSWDGWRMKPGQRGYNRNGGQCRERKMEEPGTPKRSADSWVQPLTVRVIVTEGRGWRES